MSNPKETSGLIGAGAAPPHDEEAEASVLGAVMLADRWLANVADKVGLIPGDFYRPRNRVIFAAMLELREAEKPIDTLTVAAHLDRAKTLSEAGGKDYIETLVTRIPSLGNTESYARIVREDAMLRGLQNVAYAIQKAITEKSEDPGAIAERTLLAVAEAIRPESAGTGAPTDDRLLWAADFAIRRARELTSEHDAYTMLALALRRVENDYEVDNKRRLALQSAAATALYVVARELPHPKGA